MDKPYYVIEIKTGSGAVSTHEINAESTTLGRSKKKATVVIDDPKASGAHASITFSDARVMVQDLGSTNGTYFNGEKQAGSFEVMTGQTIKIADSAITLVAIHEEEDVPNATLVSAPSFLDEEDATRAMAAFDLDAAPPPPPTGMDASRAKPMPAPSAPPPPPPHGVIFYRKAQRNG